MEKHSSKQEILLLTASSFARRESCVNDFSKDNNRKNLSPVERLEEACWNGLLTDFLEAAPPNRRNGEKLFLWKIHVAKVFLCIELSQTPSSADSIHSLDPYLFLSSRIYN